jgi:hypothetical protein
MNAVAEALRKIEKPRHVFEVGIIALAQPSGVDMSSMQGGGRGKREGEGEGGRGREGEGERERGRRGEREGGERERERI